MLVQTNIFLTLYFKRTDEREILGLSVSYPRYCVIKCWTYLEFWRLFKQMYTYKV
jgi:hypothetical protein